MRFCRNCGTSLGGPPTPAPGAMGGPPPPMGGAPMGGAPMGGPQPLAGMPPAGPLATLVPGAMPPPSSGGLPPTLPPNTSVPAIARSASAAAPPQTRPAPGPVQYSAEVPPTLPPNTPSPIARPQPAAPAAPTQFDPGGIPPTLPPQNNEIPPTMPPSPAPGPVVRPPTPAPVAQAGGGTITCPRCGTATPSSFVYCQACGLHIGAIAPTDPNMAQRPPSQPQPAPPAAAKPAAPDPVAATIAQPSPITASKGASPLASAPTWGTAVLVNRDGSDGQRFPLSSETTIIGRAGADIAFEDDRFLARAHARLERAGDGSVKINPVDAVNGVFRKADAPIELVDGITILVGREVLRYEKVEPEERNGAPLVRHGVAVFGSPPREPWGRFLQLVPSGGYRDVRHLMAEETVLGREEGDIVFRDDAFMSRRHAAVNWDGKKATLTDLGSSNGTFVRLAGPTPLKHGDHVRMGDQLLRIELGR